MFREKCAARRRAGDFREFPTTRKTSEEKSGKRWGWWWLSLTSSHEKQRVPSDNGYGWMDVPYGSRSPPVSVYDPPAEMLLMSTQARASRRQLKAKHSVAFADTDLDAVHEASIDRWVGWSVFLQLPFGGYIDLFLVHASHMSNEVFLRFISLKVRTCFSSST